MPDLTSPIMLPVRVNPLLRHPAEQRESLDGRWRFRLDPDERGIDERWFARLETLPEEITVPGCWQGQGFGDDSEEELWDFKLKARTLRATYTGTAWYGTTFQPRQAWRERRIFLNFGGAHPGVTVWLNGCKLGEHHLPFVPFGWEITDAVSFTRENELLVRVSETARPYGFAFSWQGNWSGLYRGVELTATGAHYLSALAVYPEVDAQCMRVKATIGGTMNLTEPLRLRLSVYPVDAERQQVCLEAPVTGQQIECILSIPEPRLWSPDTPNLYRIDAELLQGDNVLDAQSERAGFVKLAAAGKQLLINNAPYYLRGTGDFLSCPETGCPDTDRARWRTKLAALRAYGYNYVRCQSYVYGPEYYDAADEVGLLVQSEMGMLGAWGGSSPWHVYQWPQPTAEHYPSLKRQWDAVVQRDVNHPSANLYCMSNEYGAGTDFSRIAWQCYHDTKARKPTALVIWTDGGFNADLPGDFVNAEAETDAQCPLPLIQHEFRWWSSYPDTRIAPKYHGAVRPYAITIAEEAAARQGLSHLLPKFAENSQRLQFLEAKLKMEACRRDHPHLAGICHFNAMDTNPSPQGIIDEFYQRKYADSARWQQTNGDTVLLASFGAADRVFSAGETVNCKFSISDFSHPPFANATLAWRLVAGEEMLASGELPVSHNPFQTSPAGEITIIVPAITHPVAVMLEATLTDGSRTVENAWQLWLFPPAPALPARLGLYGNPEHTWLRSVQEVPAISPAELGTTRAVLAERLDASLLAYLHGGGRVLLAATEGMVRPHPPNFGYVKYFFTPPANYGPYEDGQNGTIITPHPMLGDFPHEGFDDLQWFRLLDDHPPLDLAPLGLTGADPVMRVIHRYPVCRPLGYLTEARVGQGAIICCALSLDQALPEARYLLAQLCAYAVSDAVQPTMTLDDRALETILTANI